MDSSKSQFGFSAKNFLLFELGGAVFSALVTAFMRRFYSLCGGELIGILFGAVNNSVWESTKLLLISYLFWGLIELLCISVPFRAFVAAKTASLCFLCAVHIGFCCASAWFLQSREAVFMLGSVCFFPASALSFFLLFGKFELSVFFVPSLFVLMLFWTIYFCFTPFPPHLEIFRDSLTRRFGLIPPDLIKEALYFLPYSA